MHCYLLILAAAVCTSVANLCIRKNLDDGGSTDAFLVTFFAMSLMASCIINPIFAENIRFSPIMLGLGMCGGIFIASIMMLTSKALAVGPSGATFAFQNSGSVMPTLALALLYGSEYGFSLTPGLIAGLVCVITGLFWAVAKQNSSSSLSKKWLFFAVMLFVMQSLLLFLFHWRCLLMEPSLPFHPLIPFKCSPEEDAWFMPGLFFAATLLQTGYFAAKHKRGLKPYELQWGICGGACNGGSTYLLLLGSMLASASVKGIAFPLFAMGVIIFCNMWGQCLYGEKVYWRANVLCIVGILIAAV